MHIPDGFLSPGVAAVTWAGASGSVAFALHRERRSADPIPSGILGSVAAFLFAAQMINVPLAPGASGHLVGATLAAVLLGPWRACLAMTAVLAVQALLFQDGGIAAFGANFIDMALCGSIVGHTVACAASRVVQGPRGMVVGGVLGGFSATLAGATLVAVWLALSGLYPLAGIWSVLFTAHVAVGLLEAALTGTILVTLLTWRPDLAAGLSRRAVAPSRVMAAGVCGVAISIAVFAGPLASSLPDGFETAARLLGLAARPSPAPWAALAAPAAAGGIGTIAAALIAWGISRSLTHRSDGAHH